MKHAPINAPDDELGRYAAGLPPISGIPSSDAEVEASDARALADFAAGRFYPHALIKRWLAERTPGLSFKEWVAAVDG